MDWVCDGDCGVQRWLESSILASDRYSRDSSEGQYGRLRREARVQAGSTQCKNIKNGLCLALKQGNVATFGATSRRYREDICQRRDVRGNVATFQRMLLNNVATLDNNVATLDSNVVTFQNC